MVGVTGLEPVTPVLSGLYSNLLNYTPILYYSITQTPDSPTGTNLSPKPSY